jgi:hypothetical protein
MTVTKQQVIAALAELRTGRSRANGNRAIRSILRQFGNGASTIGQLDPELYEAVFAAAGGTISPEDFYGVALDVWPASTDANASVELAPNRRPTLTNDNIITSTRIRTPLVAELEALLAARAGKPRSRPNYVVNIGNPGQPGDEDALRQYPSDGVKVS